MVNKALNQIQNSTIAKLNRIEIGDLGLVSKGVFTYKGELKARKQGFRTSVLNDKEVWFVSEDYAFEFIQIENADNDDKKHWALRLFDKKAQGYEEFYPILWGIDFFKR